MAELRGLPLLGLRVGETSAKANACRVRRSSELGVGYRTISPASIGSAAIAIARPKTIHLSWTSLVPGGLFLLAMLGYLLGGFLCTVFPPLATTAFDDHKIPREAQCLRATRHTNYATVDLPFGTPSTILNVLIRLDLVNEGTMQANTRLFSTKVGESNTVSCEGSVCHDAILLQTEGPTSAMHHRIMKFLYTNPTTESLNYASNTAKTIGLDGEMYLTPGHDYYLTATHFCWLAINSSMDAHTDAEINAYGEGGVPIRSVGGILRTNATNLVISKTLRASPASQAQIEGHCANTTTGEVGELSLFPLEAANEASWLGLASERAYESSPEGVEDRRTVVEVGTTCAAAHESYERAYSLYQLDCLSAYTPCETYPTVPFRRVADNQLRLHISSTAGGASYLWAVTDIRLETLPKLGERGDAMWLSVIKLLLMTLAAAVAWVRAAKSTSSHDRLFMNCVRTARCHMGVGTPIDEVVVWEDAFIGFAAVAARMAVSVWRMISLFDDGQLRAPTAQFVASLFSLGQWVVRYFVLERQCEAPLTKLGGSTALIDATSAVMLGFAQPPLLVSSEGRFDPTARLLTAILITTMTLQRCLFATACCGLLWAVAREDVELAKDEQETRPLVQGKENGRAKAHFDPEYVPILLFAALSWVLQALATGVLLADLFCVPMAYSMSRSTPGHWIELAAAIFFVTTAASLPQMMRTAQRVAEDSLGTDPAEQ